MSRSWVAVASAEHVRIGKASGFMQVCHGKAAPLRRIKPADKVVYYSPTVVLGDKVKLQAFTAIGVVRLGEPYEFDMGGGFKPFRRDVDWYEAKEVSIMPLLDRLEFSSGKKTGAINFASGYFR